MAIFAGFSTTAGAPIILAAAACIGWYLVVVPAWGSGWHGIRALCTGAFALEVLVCVALSWHAGARWDTPGPFGLLILGATCLYFDLAWVASLRRPADVLNLRFPFANGVYAVLQGGSVALFNHHHVSQQQRYALDIVESGADIFDTAIYAPCEGRIVAAVGNAPDEPNLSSAGPAVFGNYVAIEEKSGAIIVLAHLKAGSLAVRTGDNVAAGDHVGHVGNSGRSFEPHLHVHAERNLKAVPFLFNGRWLVRNSVIRGSVT